MSTTMRTRGLLSEDREQLKRSLPWTPLDFFRSLNDEQQRTELTDMLCRDLPEANDLRFVASEGGSDLAVFSERLQWDSEFMGYGVAKLNGAFSLGSPAPESLYISALGILLENCRAKGIKYLFAPVDARDLALLRSLAQNGFALIESRAYYHRGLADYEYPKRYAARAATEEDIPGLSDAAEKMINPYDRFHADPFIDPAKADALMRKWVQASVAEGFADITIVPDAPRPTAFCTVKYHREKWDQWGTRIAQPVFSAVSPEFKGWYLKIISEISYHLKDIGAQHAYMITQLTNRAVIRVWENLGYRYGKAEHVFRIVL